MFGQLKELTEVLQASPDLSPKDKFISPECQMFEDFIFRVSENFLPLDDGDSLFEAFKSIKSMFLVYEINPCEEIYLVSLMNVCLSSMTGTKLFEVV